MCVSEGGRERKSVGVRERERTSADEKDEKLRRDGVETRRGGERGDRSLHIARYRDAVPRGGRDHDWAPAGETRERQSVCVRVCECVCVCVSEREGVCVKE